MTKAQTITRETLEGMLQIARYHRDHERYYATHELEQAKLLRGHATALRELAARWLEQDAPAPAPEGYDDPSVQAAGCDDLNASAALAGTGILFMEGESEPAEIGRMRDQLVELADDFDRASNWLAEKMDAGWKRESVLLQPAYADLAYRRHMVLARTTLHGQQRAVAARLIRAAHAGLSSQTHDPKTVRADIAGSGALLRTVAWLLDSAAGMLAQESGLLAASDPDWTACIEELERRLEADSGTGAAGRAGKRSGASAGKSSGSAPSSGAGAG